MQQDQLKSNPNQQITPYFFFKDRLHQSGGKQLLFNAHKS